MILDQFLKNQAESRQAAAGWGGDHFALYETGRPDEVFVAQITAWDTPADAKEFFDAYAERTAKRYPQAKESQTTERIDWNTETGGVVMELRGSRVVIFEGVPKKTNADALLRLIWQQG